MIESNVTPRFRIESAIFGTTDSPSTLQPVNPFELIATTISVAPVNPSDPVTPTASVKVVTTCN